VVIGQEELCNDRTRMVMSRGSVARILGTDDDNAGRQQRTGHVTLQCHLEPAVEGAATLSVSML
jgi:hypothetical protein